MPFSIKNKCNRLDMFENLIEQNKIGGINTLIWKNGQVLSRESYGYKDLETKAPMTGDVIFRISSMTKPITSVLALMLYEEGKLDLYDAITIWFPQFQNMKVVGTHYGEYESATRPITIFDLLTHSAGFTYSEFQQGAYRDAYVATLGGDIDSMVSNDDWINGLASLPLASQPGSVFNYGRSTDLLGLLIAKIEAKTLYEVMQEKIFTPLGMSDTFFDVPTDKKHRCAPNFGFDNNGQLVQLNSVPLNMAMTDRPKDLAYQSGGQGLWSTMDDYLQFAKIFIGHGSVDKVQILKKETTDLMCTNHLTPEQRANSYLMGNPIFKLDYGFGLGVAVAMQDAKYGSMPCLGINGAVGWPGAYGGWWFANPMTQHIGIFLTHSMTEPNQLAQGIGFELYEAIDIFASYCRD